MPGATRPNKTGRPRQSAGLARPGRPESPAPALTAVAWDLGFVDFFPDSDGVARRMLGRLEAAPASVERTCDWAIKRALFMDHLRRRGLNADSIEAWTRVLARLNDALQRLHHHGPATVDFVLSEQSPVADEVERLGPYLKEKGLVWDGLTPFLLTKRELFEIDTRFGQLGEKGVFASLDRAGVLAHHLPGVDNIEHAMSNPPAIGRAELRGRCVKRFAGAGGRYACDWTGVWDLRERRMLDLTLPFASQEVWRDMPGKEAPPDAASRAGVREVVSGLRHGV